MFCVRRGCSCILALKVPPDVPGSMECQSGVTCHGPYTMADDMFKRKAQAII